MQIKQMSFHYISLSDDVADSGPLRIAREYASRFVDGELGV
jgi:hypothetical protein